ncbi:MAG TPA: hypothetical protein VHT73_17815 [Thermodesulfobacteriota bacterium]|nr:hypothetical protein [Thermodesulfobacteriota bacterium]
MSLIDLIEKLITEHGSPAILKKRLELLRDQISVFEKKNSALKLDNTILKSKKNTIQSELNKARKEIERLNQYIQELEKDEAKIHLDAVTEKVLETFFRRYRDLSPNEVAASLSIDVSTAWHHFDLLLEKNLIEQAKVGFVPPGGHRRDPHFRLTLPGRKYIIKRIVK